MIFSNLECKQFVMCGDSCNWRTSINQVVCRIVFVFVQVRNTRYVYVCNVVVYVCMCNTVYVLAV